ncbi:G-protein coupled receptor Mth2-like isoform X5 [Tenebrio molitor]|uniref:G-protein coupled receptor Mth2-like isoform X5 n=1 Tax=Tenebrio molitor TaxID=7067 RepID=UPI003624AA0B
MSERFSSVLRVSSSFRTMDFATVLICHLLALSTCICLVISENVNTSCIRKCCPENSILSSKNRSCVAVNEIRKLPHKNLCVVSGCRNNKVLIGFPENNYTVLENNSLSYNRKEGTVLFEEDDYCLDHQNNFENVVALLCVEAPKNDTVNNKALSVVGMIISMPFLLATFIAYALLPDRNLHMKALMFYVINLMLSYLLLVIIQLTDSRFSQGVCTSIGYFCLLFFLVSFFWMNVICIDIWFTFSGLRGFTGSKKSAERKRFFMYSAYAWAVPILHVLIVYIIDTNSKENSWFSPGIGKGQCFLRRGYPELLYFYGPMAILITINIILFAVTAFKIRSIKKETSMLKKEDSKRHSYENDKQTFNLYLKLLFAMGVNWSMEIISWAVIWSGKAPDAIWYLTDFCNAIYGVFIFFIFVFKRSIWKLLKKRYYTFIGKPYLAHSMTMTNTTRVTSYSTANSSVAENPHGVHDTSTLTSEA